MSDKLTTAETVALELICAGRVFSCAGSRGRAMSASYDDLLAGWDAALAAVIEALEGYRRRHPEAPVAHGWADGVLVARRLRGDARTQKGFLFAAAAQELHKEDL